MQVLCQQRDLRPAVFGGRIRYSLRSAKHIVFSMFFQLRLLNMKPQKPRTSIAETWNEHLPGHTIFKSPAVIFPGFESTDDTPNLVFLCIFFSRRFCGPCWGSLSCPLNTNGGFLFCSLLPRTENQHVYYPEKWLKKHDPLMFNLKWSKFPKDMC